MIDIVFPLWLFALWSLLVGGFGSIMGYFIARAAWEDGYDAGLEDVADDPEAPTEDWTPIPREFDHREPSEVEFEADLDDGAERD